MFFFYFFEQTEEFVGEMFNYLNIEYERDVSIQDKRIDYIIKGTNNLDTLVEVKEIKNNYRDAIISAIDQMKDYRNIYPKEQMNKYSFVIIMGSVNQEQKDYFAKQNIIIIDISNILYLIKDNQDLISSLKDILPFSIVDIVPKKIQLEKYINYVKESKTQKKHLPEEKLLRIEDKYINQLKNITKGIEGSREFEIVGEKILKYLFGDYLYDWKSQVNCDNNLHRIDLLGKVKQQEGFWKMLSDIYRSRYIIFDFKNYNNKITQEQVESTNKYLNKMLMHKKRFTNFFLTVWLDKMQKKCTYDIILYGKIERR